MAHNENTIAAFETAKAILPDAIQKTEDALGSGNGDLKHAIVKGIAVDVFTAGEGAVAANNPKLAGYIGLFDLFIRAFIASRKAKGNPVTATPISNPVPVSGSVTGNPTTVALP